MPSHPKPEPRAKTKRRRVNPVSNSRKEENALRAELRPHWFNHYNRCELTFPGHVCWGGLTVHEAHTRGRSGGIIADPRSWFTICIEGNRALSQSPVMMRWGTENGLLFHEREGREWLDAGGRFPGLSKEQAIEQVRSW